MTMTLEQRVEFIREQCSGVPGDATLRYETCGRWPDD